MTRELVQLGGWVSDMKKPRTNGQSGASLYAKGSAGTKMPNCEQNLGCLDLFLARANS